MCIDYYNIKKLPDFPFLKEKKHIISIVGAGGKTSTMYSIAKYYAKQGLKVIVTTSTHIRKPYQIPLAKNEQELERIWENGDVAVIGKETTNNKLCMLEYEELKRYLLKADIVLIEADGAKELPCKVPDENEPVIIPESDIVIGVIGLDCLNKPLIDVCFRIQKATDLLQKQPNDLMTIEDIYKILVSPNGSRKNVNNRDFYVVLNKCSNEQLDMANELAKKLEKEIKKENIAIIMKGG